MQKYIALIVGDLHLHHSPPKKRVGEWVQDMQGVLDFIVAKANKYEVPVIFCGDVFHSSTETPLVETMLVRALADINEKVYAIPGQHDLRFHRQDLRNTSYELMAEYAEGFYKRTGVDKIGDVYFHFFPWNWKKATERLSGKHVYVGHALTTDDNCPGMIPFREFAQENEGYCGYILGDNHKPFFEQEKNYWFLSPGSVMNRDIDQEGRAPFLWLMKENAEGFSRLKIPNESRVFFRSVLEGKGVPEAKKFCEAFKKQTGRVSFEKVLNKKIMKEKGMVRELLEEMKGVVL